MDNSRTKNAVRNIIFGFLNKIIVLFFPFVLRTIMIKTLGSEYLGLNSLFTSILQVLNLAELGFSSAIVFSMYEPIAKKDKDTICALMNLYKKVYFIIGLVILIIGLLLLPFLKILIKGSYPDSINIYVLFILYLIETSITYFLFAYKSALIQAHQRNDIISNALSLTKIIQFIIQIIILTKFKNYYLYVIIGIITSILNNIIVAIISHKKYPEYICYGSVDKKTKKNIKTKITGLMIQKVCSTTRNSLDSIFISAFLGLNIVAVYNNYYTIMNSILGLMGIVSSAILAGVGNSIVTESKKKNYEDMNKFNFIYMIVAGLCTICMGCLYQPFMEIWMGKDLMLPYGIVLLICLYFYLLKMGDIRAVYSDAKGLWWENRYRAILETIANIFLNFILAKLFGLYGIIIGTIISLFSINFIWGSQIIFKHYFIDEKVTDYFKKHLLYFCVTLLNFIVTYTICSFINLGGFIGLIIKGIVSFSVALMIYIIAYSKNTQYIESIKFIKTKVLKRGKKNEQN